MNQTNAPILDALAAVERHRIHGFGAPGHGQGAAVPRAVRRLLGRRVFEADVITPKGLDDRSEGGHVVQRAHEIAAAAWGVDFCRFVTGGSTQSLHTALAAVAAPGDTVLLAANVHKAERAHAIVAGLDAHIVPVVVDRDWDIEHGVAPDALAVALDAHPATKAFVVVSPTYYGVTSDIAALAALCHARGVVLICDAAWGGAFAFASTLPDDALAQGVDIAVYSLHKTMGTLTQGSALLARGGIADLQRLWMAYELFETTSPSVPILASLDAARREHALDGERIWARIVRRARRLRRQLSRIPGIRVFGEDDLPNGAALDPTKVLIDISGLGVSGYAIDDWLGAERRVSVGLSSAKHLLAILSPGARRDDVRALARGLADCVAGLAGGSVALPAATATPGVSGLTVEMAAAPADAFHGPAELVPIAYAAGRIAAEIVAPAPPGVPRLVPGQRITAAHVEWLAANRDAGAFFLDPTDPSGRAIRVVVTADGTSP